MLSVGWLVGWLGWLVGWLVGWLEVAPHQDLVNLSTEIAGEAAPLLTYWAGGSTGGRGRRGDGEAGKLLVAHVGQSVEVVYAPYVDLQHPKNHHKQVVPTRSP